MNVPYRLTVFLFAIPLMSSLILTGCAQKSAEDDAQNTIATTEVTLTHVVRRDISRTLTLTGSVMAPPNQDVRISAMVSGRVAELPVAEGDRVRSGELLAKIDDRTYQDQFNQAEAAQAQAEANLENAKLSLDRNQNLVDRGIAARKDLEDSRTLASVAASSVKQTTAALELARLQLQRTSAAAPFDGVVVKRFVNVGEQVDGTAAQPLVEVAALGEVELAGNVPAPDLSALHEGEKISFTSQTFPGKSFSGRVAAISPAVDPATNAGLVRIRISNATEILRLGMSMNAQVPLETHVKALAVPPQAIYRDQDGHAHVYRVTGEDSVAVPVRVGIETPDWVELLSGVSEGDAVILTGGYGLADKSKVAVKGTSAR
jgi:RND family efflux transporter MFP subunit